MKTSDFNYHLPEEYIAQTPVQPRDKARMLIVDRKQQSVSHSQIADLPQYLLPGDLLVINKTRVIPARLAAEKIPTGGKAEILLLARRSELNWEALVGGRRIMQGQRLRVSPDLVAEVTAVLSGARREVKFTKPIDAYLADLGRTPLPPYIRRPIEDPERYQTVFAERPGSAAAPTAGLHFSPGLLSRLAGRGVRFAGITLHIGLDTFGPVTVTDPETHIIHSEWCSVPAQTVELIKHTREAGKRVVAVGTTSVRALETAAAATGEEGGIRPYEGNTNLFILPGYRFKIVDAMLTNFHLPQSTLLMMVCGFAQRELILHAYTMAISHGYRFYSFGDVMLID